MQGLDVSNPEKLLVLMESLFNIPMHDLEKKLNYYIETETNAEKAFIITLVAALEEAVIQVIGQDVLNEVFQSPIQNQMFMEALSKKSTVTNNIADLDLNLQNILEQVITREKDKSYEIVTVPVFPNLKEEKAPLLVCVVNSSKSEDFITKIVTETYRFCLPIIMNACKLEEEARIKKQCQSLLNVARRFFSHLGDLRDLLKEIMSEARRLTNAERCSLFLLDADRIHLVPMVFDGVVHNNVLTKIKIEINQGIAGHVAATGKLLNIKDAYSHPLFFKGIDEATGFRTRNILCFPIQDEHSIVGVAQLCNKTRKDFDCFDEEIALDFSIYCGLSITHSLIYKKLQEAQSRTKLSNELMIYHMKVSDEDVAKMLLLCKNTHKYLDYDCFNFSPRQIYPSETPCHILKIFEDLKFFDIFHIKENMLMRFVLHVKKGYRDTPYHNWMHAFSVTHFAYAAIKQLKLIENGHFSYLEALAYVISCMCHDIDHRGTTNSFQLQSSSVLANIYSSEGSVMEHHHLSQTLYILNTEDTNFLECLGDDEYVKCLALIKDMILATDLANHFTLMKQQEQMIQDGFNASNPKHKYTFICLLMTCADLSDQIKDWDIIKVVAYQIYNEFFKQGDLEKSMGKKPLDMMDRERASIPDLQIDFLKTICLPAFITLSKLFPETTDLVKKIERNTQCWKACKPIFEKFIQEGRLTSLKILNSTEIDDEVQKVLMLERDEARTTEND